MIQNFQDIQNFLNSEEGFVFLDKFVISDKETVTLHIESLPQNFKINFSENMCTIIRVFQDKQDKIYCNDFFNIFSLNDNIKCPEINNLNLSLHIVIFAAMKILNIPYEKLYKTYIETQNIFKTHINISSSNLEKKITIEDIRKNGMLLQYIDDQTEEICIEALQNNIESFKFIKKQTLYICKYAVQKNPSLLEFVENQTTELCQIAIAKDPFSIFYVKNQDIDLCKQAISLNPFSILKIRNPTDELFIFALQKDGSILYHINNPTNTMYDIAIESNPKVIRFLPKNCSSYIYYLKAVKQNGLVLKFVPKNLQNVELSLEAVKQNGLALEYVRPEIKKTNLNICLEAIRQNVEAFQFVEDKIPSLCFEALSKKKEYVHTLRLGEIHNFVLYLLDLVSKNK